MKERTMNQGVRSMNNDELINKLMDMHWSITREDATNYAILLEALRETK